MTSRLLTILILLVLPRIAFAGPDTHDELAAKVLKLSGMERSIAAFPEQIKAQSASRQSTRNVQAEGKAVKALIESFDPEAANRQLLAYVKNNATPAELGRMSSWLESPLATKIVAAEMETASVEGQANMLKYLKGLEQNPPSRSRIELIQRFEEKAHLTEDAVRAYETLARGFVSILNSMAPPEKRASEAELAKQLDEMRPAMRETLRQSLTLQSHYTYRDIPEIEMESYIEFLSSAEGRKLADIQVGAIVHVFQNIFAAAAGKIASGKEKQKSPAEPTAVAADALLPQEIYRRAERQVLVLETLDEKGEVFTYHTAIVLTKGKAVTQCDLLEVAAGLRLRQGAAVYPGNVKHKDGLRNLCIIDAPGIDTSNTPNIKDGEPAVGSQVYAISNSLGFGIGITEGVVSGIRTEKGESYIQFTAAIAPGSEGGGLYDAAGRLVGIITYKRRSGQNVNFALPARWLNEIEKRAADTDMVVGWNARAAVLFREAKWQELADHATKWTKALNDSADAWFWLGVAREYLKDWPAVERAYREVLQLEPSIIEAGVGLAGAMLAQGKPKEALDAARTALAYQREDARIWRTIAYAEAALGHLDEARQALERAAEIDPWNKDTFAGLAYMADLRGQLAAAVSRQQRAVQIDPQDVFAWIDLSNMYIRAGRAQRALATAERTIVLAPTNGDAWMAKGGALYALKRHHESLNAFKIAISLPLQKPVQAWEGLGDLYYELKLYPEAINAFRKALDLAPDDSTLKGRLGMAFKDSLRFEEALGLFEQLKTNQPKDPFPWRQIGYVNSFLGRAEAAIPAYEQSLSLESKDPKVWRALMETYHIAGRREDVKRAYQNLLAVDQGWAEQAYRDLLLPYEVKQ